MSYRDEWNRRYRSRALVWSAEPNQFLVSEIGGLRPGRALDLGSGEGRNAIWLAQQGWRVTAVDFSDVGLAKARSLARRSGVQVEWVLTDLREYEPPVGAFDLVAMLYVHVPADERRLILERAAAGLAPGGTILVVGHDLRNLAEGWGGPQNPAVLYTPDDIAAELSGLVVERAERVTRHVTTDEGEAAAIDALVRAHRPA